MEENKKKIININVLNVLNLLKRDKRTICIYVGFAAVLGLIVAFTTPKIYKSTVILAPEESGAGFSGSISSLASMVGMNMRIGQTGDAIYPEIYPDLVSSTDFLIGLFPVMVTTEKQDVKCDYYTYLLKHTKAALTDYPFIGLRELLKLLTSKDKQDERIRMKGVVTPLWLTKEEDGVAKMISDNINCSVDKKTNVITITVTDQDPLVAALMADSVKSHLQVAITDYRTKKARVDLDYMQKLFDEIRRQYDKARQVYASYADANQDVLLQSYKMKEEDLENDMQLKYNIYQQVVEQLQLANAKVQERTPAFTVIQSATVPLKHSSRSKLATLIIWMFLGLMLRTGIVLWKNRKVFIM